MNTGKSLNRIAVFTALFVTAGILGGVSTASAQGNRCPEGDPKVVRVDLFVDYEAGEVLIDKPTVEIFLGGDNPRPRRVCWEVENLQQHHTLTFESKDPSAPVVLPNMNNKKIKGPNGFANSGNPSRIGTWVYALVVTDKHGDVVAETDPQVIVRGNQ
ncbi:MAG: hypothetical protein GY906_18635 [bacterium]|nr:hypothetical protein [bacterium]